MKSDEILLRELAKPGVHSGEDLGHLLGISRAAVSKRMAQLRQQGLPVVAAAGQGYCIEAGVRLLDENAIRSYLKPSTRDIFTSIQIESRLESTNELLQQTTTAPGRARLLLAESQDGGRGRRERRWYSSPWRNLMMSLTWHYQRWPPSLPSLSLLVGLVVSEALELVGVAGAKIKWPNDIYLNGKKLGGILVGARGEASGGCELVIGIGINVDLLPQHGAAIDQAWTDLRSQGYQIDRNELAALISEGLVELLPVFEREGFAPWQESWNRRALYKDQRVRLFGEGRAEIIGVLCGAEADGALIIQTTKERVQVRDAEYSLRLHPDSE